MIAKRQRYAPIKEQTKEGSGVGFLSAAYMKVGGTETFHQTLIPRLAEAMNVLGFAATAFYGGDGANLCVPYTTGPEAATKLASECDVVVSWGITNLDRILPKKRPKVIAVHHADWSSDWSNGSILNQIRSIDSIVCVNEDTAHKLKACGKLVVCIPNAIDPKRIAPSGKQYGLCSRFNIPANHKIVLFGHRLSSEKRPLLAVEIAEHLPDDWTMVIAGNGPEAKAVEEAAHDKVKVIGAVDSLADWLWVADCFLSLATFEGFGLAIGEAMAAGLPTVSTPTGIAPGLATTLPTNSKAAEWAQAIVNATQKVTPAEILERFSVDRMVDAWINVIRNTR